MSPASPSVLLDENVERQVLEYLEREGIEGEHVVDVLGPGVEDATDIAPYASTNDLVIVTKDTDFLRMDDSDYAGVLFVADHRASTFDVAIAIVDMARAFPDRDYFRGVNVVDDWF